MAKGNSVEQQLRFMFYVCFFCFVKDHVLFIYMQVSKHGWNTKHARLTCEIHSQHVPRPFAQLAHIYVSVNMAKPCMVGTQMCASWHGQTLHGWHTNVCWLAHIYVPTDKFCYMVSISIMHLHGRHHHTKCTTDT